MRIFRNIGVIAFIFFLTSLFLFAGALQRSLVAFPFVSVASVPVGLKTPFVFRQEIEKALSAFEKTQFFFIFEGEAKEVFIEELGFRFDLQATLAQIPLTVTQNPFRFFVNAFTPRRINPVFSLDQVDTVETLRSKFSTVILKKDASFTYDVGKKQVMISAEQAGFVFREDRLFDDIEKRVMNLSNEPIVLTARIEDPNVDSSDLEPLLAKLSEILPSSLNISAPEDLRGEWNIKFPENVGIFAWKAVDASVPAGAVRHVRPLVDETVLSIFLKEQDVEKTIEVQAGSMKILRDENGKVHFEGMSNAGKAIDREALLAVLNEALVAFAGPDKQKKYSVTLPVKEIAPVIEISEDLRAIGVTGLIGKGYTTFRGSPRNRIHNIQVGVQHYDGMIIPPEATFSFNENLGPVDANAGYKPELVIKAEGTIPEYGGGLCQVSTTMYRAVLFSGLPVIDRSPHSYAVTYYSQVGGHGIDATIYPGVKDLKFSNDTSGAILVHSYADSISATFEFYGTKDGREVRLEGPYTANPKGAPPDQVIYTVDLPVGKKEVKEKPHAGFETTWYRYVKKGGTEMKETIFSRYRAMPAKVLVGGEGPVRETDPLVEAAKRFE